MKVVKLLSYREKLTLGILLLLVAVTAVLVTFKDSSLDVRKQALETACYLLLFDGKNNQEAGPIGARIGSSGLCIGALGEEYSSWYSSREETLADKQTANYPCKAFPDKEESCQLNPTTVGKKVCAGGPNSEYIWCIHPPSNQIIKLSGPNSIPTEPTPTPTTQPAESCPGFDRTDLNCDGDIDLADYEIMLESFSF